ncbi:putative monovalent cation/H+ antiporter subunit A [Marinospirillum alkaliphilum]|uniref:Multisubunit sodium/proton antiporter, MrpA subunit n=1 Tax=Marinospirillum alkaliphilum DSM 21637 TaxID=1122209 RepID=A0A1K1ZFV1_9GAMM|nr:putative monovalent cation/H+ antiporter subunit A [Marinospirillum alkaliphilum]SFX73122.1 multisubunit sodium/proton antiporter, MrpA subunit [Marinospirillum alkaliphilum DSM 21637]
MQLAVLSGFLLAALVPLLSSIADRRLGWLVALLPAALAVWFAGFLPEVMAGQTLVHEWAWIPGLDISLTFVLDGLSLLFALLITVIGTFVFLYASAYLAGHPDLTRFYVVLLAFMASMLGLVLSDSLITLFVFWELTSITSYLLIGFNHQDADARKAALQGLFVTVGGGLALLAGMVMLAQMSGSYSLQEILVQDGLSEHPLYLAALLCLLGGAFTKSAQFPFHFWLPNAMAAPTPVSSYLHSATMVKAGVYLLARLHPAMGGTEIWQLLLPLFGATTMFVGAFLAIRSTGVKKLLAYSTVMALGTLTLLLGIGTETAMIAFAAFLLGHSLYKGALFMVAGALDHSTGTKDVTRMGGLRKAMPVTAAAALVAGLSLAGLPPLFGFVAKELLFEAVLGGSTLLAYTVTLALASAMLVIAVAAIIALKPFYGALKETPHKPHEAAWPMLAGPVVLAALSLVFGVWPGLAGDLLVQAAASSVAGQPIQVHLYLWHGINAPLLMSLASLLVGALIFWRWDGFRQRLSVLDPMIARGPEAGYFKIMDGLVWIAAWQTRVLQNGSMRNYLSVILMTFVLLVGYTLLWRYQVHWNWDLDVRLHELVVVGLLVAAAGVACATASRLGAVASMGAVGFSVALIFVLFSAPDLGITQVLVETLTVILLVLVLFRLPAFVSLSTPRQRFRDAVVALLTGGLMTLLIMKTIDVQVFPSISEYMVEQSQPLAYGRNIVNVILVDFRALDTLGEIFVLALAAMGVYAMLKLHPGTEPGSNLRAGSLILPRREDDVADDQSKKDPSAVDEGRTS